MQKNLNYEDNIFILNKEIRLVSDLLILETSPTLFFDKTIEDVDFIGKTSQILLGNLLENTQLVEWDEQLHNLYETEEQFMHLLNRLSEGDGSISALKFPDITDKLESLASDCEERMSIIKDKIGADAGQMNDPRIVNEDELSALFSS